MKYIKIIRPQQWVKNLFVFVPAFFNGDITDGCCLLVSLIVFAAFSLAASSIYCLNDIIDVEDDRRHPVKCLRPVASGAVSVPQAYTVMGVSLALSLAVMTLVPANRWQVFAAVAGYWALNVAYCLLLKRHSIIDVCVIAFGFVLRLLAGAAATDITLSKWIVLMTFLITLFLALAKRRDDVLRMNKTGRAPRRNTKRYNLTFLNQAITITAAVTLVCYIMYTVSPEVTSQLDTDSLYLTSVFVIMGLLRYLQIAVVDEKSGDPTDIALHDRFTQIVVVCWMLSFLLLIYVI